MFGAPGTPTLAEAMAEEPPKAPVTGARILWGPIGKEEAEVAGLLRVISDRRKKGSVKSLVWR